MFFFSEKGRILIIYLAVEQFYLPSPVSLNNLIEFALA